MGEANLGLLKKLFHKKNTDEMNFSSIKTHEMALELYQKNILVLLYIVPLKFGGEDESNNILYVPGMGDRVSQINCKWVASRINTRINMKSEMSHFL